MQFDLRPPGPKTMENRDDRQYRVMILAVLRVQADSKGAEGAVEAFKALWGVLSIPRGTHFVNLFCKCMTHPYVLAPVSPGC